MTSLITPVYETSMKNELEELIEKYERLLILGETSAKEFRRLGQRSCQTAINGAWRIVLTDLRKFADKEANDHKTQSN